MQVSEEVKIPKNGTICPALIVQESNEIDQLHSINLDNLLVTVLSWKSSDEKNLENNTFVMESNGSGKNKMELQKIQVMLNQRLILKIPLSSVFINAGDHFILSTSKTELFDEVN